MSLPLILTVDEEVTVGYPGRKAFQVTMLDASNKQFTFTMSPAQKEMFLYIKCMNITSREKDRLWDMFEAFGEEEYSRGYDCADMDNAEMNAGDDL